MALLEVKDLRVGFPTRRGTVQAIDGVDFSLAAGQTLGVVGESGCGKSVTALSLMRLLPPRAVVGGEVTFDQKAVNALSRDELRRIRGKDIAMIYQDPMTSLNPVLSVGRQITESLELHLDMSRRAARDRAVELLQMVGIPDATRRVDDHPHQFSGGMRQRVMIAMAIACRPKLILADEVTTALDVTIQAQILELLKSIVSEFDTSLLMITHNLGIIAGMTERAQVMYAGQIVERAATVDLFASPQMPYTWGLLRSVPRLQRRVVERLVPIDGRPPDLMSPPTGCRFAPRCQYRRTICTTQAPALLPILDAGAGHETRCWGTQQVPEGGWLIGRSWRTDSIPSARDVRPAGDEPNAPSVSAE